MFRGIGPKFSAFGAGESGIVLFLVALLMVPFVVLIGVAVDVGELLLVKNQLAASIDAAALDIGATPGLTQAQANAQAQAFVNANFSTQYPSATVSLPLNVTLPQQQSSGSCPANTVCITASASVSTSFVRILGSGYNTLSTTVSTQVTAAQSYLEVVLVFDNTGSMGAYNYGNMTGIDGLKAAANTLVNTLIPNTAAQQYVKVALVPFTVAVNVGSQYASASWIDSGGLGSLTSEDLQIPATKGLLWFYDTNQLKYYDANGNLANLTWGGCVRQRTEANGKNYDVQDVAPDATGDVETLYTPYFAPDEPDCCTTPNDSTSQLFANSYISDGTTCAPPNTKKKRGGGGGLSQAYTTTAKEQAEQQCIAKYSGGVLSGTNQGITSSQGIMLGPNLFCPQQAIQPLTNDPTTIRSAIAGMTASGNTVIPSGLEWGWHLISPNVSSVIFPDTENQAAPYTDTKTVKAIVLVTDGDNHVSAGSNGFFDNSTYTSYGYANGTHISSDNDLNTKLLQLCANIKAVTDANGNPNRILLYTIGFGDQISNNGLLLLQQCATDASYSYYNPTSDQLNTTFQNIALGLSKLRISR